MTTQPQEPRERLVVELPASLKRQVEQRAQANRRSLARQVQVELEGHVAPVSQTRAAE